MQLTLEESSYKLSGHLTLFFIRRLKIIYFDLNVFLKRFNSLCTIVDLCSILRFIQRAKLLLILMFMRMATKTRKRTHFNNAIKIKLFSIYGSITHSASVCRKTYFRCRQRFACPPAFLLKFFHIYPPMLFKIPVCK